jgi:DNA-binding GntR family transcriptional regulator
VYARIGEAILDGTLQPGEHLRDHELAARLGVSRTPVREALQRLERSGLVEVAPNRYTRVSVPHAKALTDTHEFLVHMMGNVSRLALGRCSDDELADLVQLMDSVIAASRSDDLLGILDASAAMFERLTYAADNAAILRVMREGELAIRRSLAGWRPVIACPINRSAMYEQFRDAVAARDGDEAERLLRELHTPA